MIRTVCFAGLIIATSAAPVRADWPSSCPGGVCPVRNVALAPAIVMTPAPAVRNSSAEGPPAILTRVESVPVFPILRAVAEGRPIVAPVCRVVTLPVRLIRWLRNSR
jgi:hypothetical protein